MALWPLFLAVLAVCVWWHFRENRKLTRRWKKQYDASTAAWFTRFSWSRSAQLLVALAACMLVITIYDWQLRDARASIDALEKAKADLEQKLAQEIAKASATAPVQPEIPVAVATETPSEQTMPPPPIDSNTAMEDIYNPEEQHGDNQSAMDAIKKRYEDILVIYMFLKKCGRVNPGDYNVITSALAQEMASVNAPGRLQYDILTAAQGSYKEMYERSTCNGPDVGTLYNQYNSYIASLSKNLTTP